MTNQPQTLPDALRDAAQRFPDHLAYVEGSQRVTWAELAQRADNVAAGLVALGLSQGDRTAICAENSIDWLTAYHAIVRAGGIPVLIYFELTRSEIEEQVRRPQCRVLFASADVFEKLEDGIEGVEHVVLIGEGASPGISRPSTGGPVTRRGDSRIAPTGDAGPANGDSGGSTWEVIQLQTLVTNADAGAHEDLARRAPDPDDTAVIVYTSGTTGGAKGVMLSHRNLLSNADAAIEALDLTGEDSSLLVLPMHHALPFLAAAVLPPLIGAHFVIENDLRRIRDRLQEHRPTIFFGVPALYELVYRNILARAEAEGRLKTLQRVQRVTGWVKRLTGINLAPYAFRSVGKALGGRLKFLVSGGAALNPQTVRDFSSLGLLLLQGWGMTEASPVIAVQRYDRRRFMRSNYYEAHAGSVGPPLPGVEVRLVDVPEKGISVAEAGEGEVQILGPSVFTGYWHAPDATAEAMQDGWLRTGDLGRLDAEGNIYLTGRSKYVIVLESGEKVHPDEVEAVLAQSDLLQDVCIAGREITDARSTRTHVTAIVYPTMDPAQAREQVSSEDALRRLVEGEIAELCKQLASYKRVTRVELSDTPLPKTALRKVARGQLRDAYEFDYETWLASAAESAVDAV